MEADLLNKNFTTALPFDQVLSAFFAKNTPESSKHFFWKMFQCWVIKDCNIKAETSDEEVALFFDQLIDLVAAAHTLHEANRAQTTGQKGDNT